MLAHHIMVKIFAKFRVKTLFQLEFGVFDDRVLFRQGAIRKSSGNCPQLQVFLQINRIEGRALQ